jgi:hypothetical protein
VTNLNHDGLDMFDDGYLLIQESNTGIDVLFARNGSTGDVFDHEGIGEVYGMKLGSFSTSDFIFVWKSKISKIMKTIGAGCARNLPRFIKR